MSKLKLREESTVHGVKGATGKWVLGLTLNPVFCYIAPSSCYTDPHSADFGAPGFKLLGICSQLAPELALSYLLLMALLCGRYCD